MTENRRHYSRIRFQASATLSLADGEIIPVEVADLSLKGALVRPVADPYIQVGSHSQLAIRLDDEEARIDMAVTVVHHQGALYGLACTEIDLDSVTHLRRLVALNLGDDALAEREVMLLAGH